MRIIFVRHGETKVNTEGTIHVTNDTSELTARGITQISKSIPVLKRNNITKIYCSPEKRAIQSAKLASLKLNIPLKIINELRERNWGDWEGKKWTEVSTILEKMSLNERFEFIPPNGESWQQMERRLKALLRKITSGSELCVAVVTHAGSLRGLMPLLKNKERSISLKYDFENASITIFDFVNNHFNEVAVNDTSHLE